MFLIAGFNAIPMAIKKDKDHIPELGCNSINKAHQYINMYIAISLEKSLFDLNNEMLAE